jgi:Zn-dependent protease with chaperone function
MGYLSDIVLAIGALALSEAGATSGWNAPWAVLLLCLVPHVLAWAARREVLRGKFKSGQALLRVLQYSAPTLYLCALVLFGWQSSVARWLGREVTLLAWPELSLLIVFLPFVVYQALAIDARSRAMAPAGREQRAWRNFQVRMFLSGVVPITTYIVIAAAIGWDERLCVRIQEVALYNALFATSLLLLLALGLPWILCNTWETEPISAGPTRELLDAVATRARFRSRSLRVWKTGHQMANAAIVGISARSRVVLFSDSLLSELDLRELAAVFAHEIGHAVRHHVPIFVMWVSAFFFGADLLATWWFPDNLWLSGGLILSVMAIWYFAFGFMSRRFELDADLYSLDLLGDANALISALERVGGRLRDVASWRHFSTAVRVRFLSQAALDPAAAVRLRRNLRCWTCVGAALFLVTAGLQIRALFKAKPAQEIQADLRLGDYATAARRLRDMRELDPDVAALVVRASTLERDGVDGRELEREARSALRAHDIEAALAWLELGELRGRSDLGDVRAALRSKLRGEIASVADGMPRELWNAWREVFEP